MALSASVSAAAMFDTSTPTSSRIIPLEFTR
jgi:hypothetical protein